MTLKILELLAKYNVSLEKLGGRYRAHCPLPGHEDNNPSFVAFPETDSFYCFSCQRGGGTLQFVMHMERVSRQKAQELLGIDDPAKEVEALLSSTPPKEVSFNVETNYIVSSIMREKFIQGLDLSKGLIFLAKFDQELLTRKLTEEQAKDWIKYATILN